jgi:hypothetical protein
VLIIPNHGNAIWDSGGDFPGQMPVPDFSDKDLARIFCNSCNS